MLSSIFSAATISPRVWPEAAAVALKTGMDNECADFFTKATTNSDYVPYVDAVKQGLLTEKDIDVAVKRLVHRSLSAGNVRSS